MIKKVYYLPKGTEPEAQVINNLLTGSIRQKQIEHYNKLEAYMMNEAVVSRQAPHKILAVTNFARYISKTNVGYLLGNPVQYLVSDGYNIDAITDSYRKQTIGKLDVELATDASVFGHAFERIYTDENSDSWSTRVDPRNVILVYDDTVKHEKMFAVVYVPSYDEKGEVIRGQFEATILTPTMVMERTLKNGELIGDGKDDTAHSFGEVPIIEYMNSSDRIGDFEPVISLIDAYNILQSDRVIDRERLVDAILAFYGSDFDEKQRKELKDSRIIANMPEGSKIEYVIKNIDEADADVLRQTIATDIHKISMTPDMSDEKFAGNSSGVAILYKLLAFEQHIKDKERYFEDSLMDRFRLYNNFLVAKSTMAIVPTEEIDAVFKRALPQNDLETSQMINNLIGTELVDKETLAAQLSFVQDAKETVELAEAEAGEDMALGNYGTDEPNEPENGE